MAARVIDRVLIVRHPADPFEQTAYIVHVLADQWRQRGLSVDVTCEPAGEPDPRQLVIPHLDVTRTPPAFQRFFERCPRVVNRNVTDISKRRVSTNLVTGPRAYDGPVIVKTNRNAGGAPEKYKANSASGIVARARRLVSRRLPWTINGALGPLDYRVYDHPRQVPWPVWRNPRLVVEKFLPERHEGLYCLRQYVFFGSCEMNTLAMSAVPIVKARNVCRRESLPESPSELRDLRRAMGFDFGKFDYVMHDGRPVLFDANRTPTYNPGARIGPPSQALRDLSLGIEAFGDVAAHSVPAVGAIGLTPVAATP